MAAIDPHVSRQVSLAFEGRTLTVATSLALFSSAQVDVGTRMLLRTLVGRIPRGSRVLDLGCGTGPLGLALATLPEVDQVTLVDRDALALAFAAENAVRNGLPEGHGERVTVEPSLGVDDVRGLYHVVVSNVPGKAGEPVIASLIAGACAVLYPGGILAVVVIEPIRDFVDSVFETLRVEVLLRHETADYGVFHVRPRAAVGVQPAFDSGIYDRGTLEVEDARGEAFSIATVHGLPHYDRSDPVEALLTRRLPLDLAPATVLVANVGQGALPVVAHRAYPDARIVLVDTDLLALRNARRNLLAHGCAEDRIELRHQPWWDPETPSPQLSPFAEEGTGRSGPPPPSRGRAGERGALSLQDARAFRSASTDAERALWKALRAHRFAGYKFRRQQPLGPFFVDFVCFERRLVIEVNGGHHVTRAAYDAARTRWLEHDGYRVLRFTDREALTAIGGVQDVILLALEAEAPSPPPSPARREGADLAIAVLNEREGPAATEQEYLGIANALRTGGRALVAASSTATTRLIEGTPLPRGLKATRYRHRGTSVLTVA